MKVYLAGATKQLGRIRLVASRLESMGFEITHKWWEGLEVEPHDASIEDKRKWAIEDLEGIRKAATTLVLWPEDQSGSAGLKIEMGYAMAVSPRVVVAGPCRSIFSALTYHLDTDEKALTFLSVLRKGLTP